MGVSWGVAHEVFADLSKLYRRVNKQTDRETERTGQDRTGQDRTGQDRTGQDRTGQDRTGQDRTERARERERQIKP